MVKVMKTKVEGNRRGGAAALRGKFNADGGGGLRKLIKAFQDGVNVRDAENGSIIKGDNI